MPYMFLMPVFADDILMVGATGMGLLFAVSGFGVFIAGAMAEYFGVDWAVGGLAGGLILICLLAMALFPRIRKLD